MSNYLDNKELCKAILDYKIKRTRKTEHNLVDKFTILIDRLTRTYKGVDYYHDEMKSQSYLNLFSSISKFKIKPDCEIGNLVKIKSFKYIKKELYELNYNSDEIDIIRFLASTNVKVEITKVDDNFDFVDVIFNNIDETFEGGVKYDKSEIRIPIKFIDVNNAFAWFTACVYDSFKQALKPDNDQHTFIKMNISESKSYDPSIDFSTDFEKNRVRSQIRESRIWFAKKKLRNKYHVVEKTPGQIKPIGIFEM